MSGCKQDPCKPCYPYPNPGGCCEDGKSAFEIWRENQPHGADISLEAFLKYMEGKKGDKGDQGELGRMVLQVRTGSQGRTVKTRRILSALLQKLLQFNRGGSHVMLWC